MKLSVLAALAAMGIGAASAQAPLREGNVVKLDIAVELGGEPAAGAIHWSRRIEEPGVRSIRLRFRDIVDAGSGDYSIVLRDRVGRVVQTLGKSAIGGQRELWTQIVEGDYVRVEVVGASRPIGLSFTIAEAAYQRTPFATYSISEPDEREAVAKYANEPSVFARTRPVAKLLFVDDAFAASCTGFLIDDERMLTNHHCVATAEVCRTTVAVFGYEVVSGRLNAGQQYQCLEVLAEDRDLDMALLKLTGKPGTVWGRLELTRRTLERHEQAYMIQHPAGEPKQISRKGCSITTLDAPGSGGPASTTDFGHKCDTLGGSSGSPVLGHDFRVVGLHHLGFGGGGQWAGENRAVQIRLVMDRLGLP
jgi:V8-like Glu-specific endopeptidase